MSKPQGGPILDQIVGERLSGVMFVLDYYQFQFDDSGFSVLTPVEVVSEAAHVRSGDDQFRNRVCAQIGKTVRTVKVHEGHAIEIVFDDESRLHFSLREADYPGPEAVLFHGNNGAWNVY